MYKGFFGLKETPFSIAPNPHYLYLSDRHKEALAHLMFGLRETGGFVLLTGEVGTGKTTTSRCLLEQVPDDTQVAFILNPTLTEHELLATICDEFSINYDADATIKNLTDEIRDFLLLNHKSQKNALLIIDEAQHLRSEVLEQLRLLTNLETNTKKLLQVILIGQPELQELLRRKELRQLAQRITARYHLLPLTQPEVASYVIHRLKVAGCERGIFTDSAMKKLHKLSGGIPRIINLLCDRALMGAYGQSKALIDHKIVAGAAVEALGTTQPTKWNEKLPSNASLQPLVEYFGRTLKLTKFKLAFSCAFAVLFAITINLTIQSDDDALISYPVEEKAPAKLVLTSHLSDDDELIKQARSLPNTFYDLLTIWQIDINEQLSEPCEQVVKWDLSCYWMKGSLPSVITLNYPTILQLFDRQGNPFYGILTTVEQGKYKIQLGIDSIMVDRAWLDLYWRGGAVVLWQKPDEYSGVINPQSELEYIQWLEDKLALVLDVMPRKVTEFDAHLQRNLHQFQNLVGLPLSPQADEETLITLHHKINRFGPRLIELEQVQSKTGF